MYGACTNLEAVHLVLHDDPADDIDLLSLMCTKLVSVSLRDPDHLILAGDRCFSVLSSCSILKEVELVVSQLAPEDQ